MAMTVMGIVKNGLVVPSAPLPEGNHVEIHVLDPEGGTPADLEVELAAWQLAGAQALSLVDELIAEKPVQ